MGGYTKNIAVIRGLKDGFSANGGELSGLVKAEKYGSVLKIEASLINFAPLSEGRYVIAVSDGVHTQILDGECFEGASEVDTGNGFAALVCFVKGGAFPIASAVCGNYQAAALGIRQEIERAENLLPQKNQTQTEYEDEAVAEENYYEFEQVDEDGGAVCEDKEEKENLGGAREDAAAACALEGEGTGGLARGDCFYDKMKDEIENIFASYPAEDNLEKLIEGSRWARISYGDGKFYVFGLLVSHGEPQYICYGVPSADSSRPPDSLKGMASFIPAAADDGKFGYWVMYQDARTGASVKIQMT